MLVFGGVFKITIFEEKLPISNIKNTKDLLFFYIPNNFQAIVKSLSSNYHDLSRGFSKGIPSKMAARQ